MPFEDLVYVPLPADEGDIPFLDVPDALGVLQPGRGNQGDVPEACAAEIGDDGQIGIAVQVLRLSAEVLQLLIAEGAELLQVILHPQLVLLNRRLADDGIEVEAILRHTPTGRRRPVPLRVHEHAAIGLWLGVELLRHQDGCTIEELPGFPAPVLEAEQVLTPFQPYHVHSQRFLQIIGDLSQHLVRFPYFHPIACPIQAQRTAQLRYRAHRHPGDGCAAQVYGHSVRNLMVQDLSNSLP